MQRSQCCVGHCMTRVSAYSASPAMLLPWRSSVKQPRVLCAETCCGASAAKVTTWAVLTGSGQAVLCQAQAIQDTSMLGPPTLSALHCAQAPWLKSGTRSRLRQGLSAQSWALHTRSCRPSGVTATVLLYTSASTQVPTRVYAVDQTLRMRHHLLIDLLCECALLCGPQARCSVCSSGCGDCNINSLLLNQNLIRGAFASLQLEDRAFHQHLPAPSPFISVFGYMV